MYKRFNIRKIKSLKQPVLILLKMQIAIFNFGKKGKIIITGKPFIWQKKYRPVRQNIFVKILQNIVYEPGEWNLIFTNIYNGMQIEPIRSSLQG